MATKINAKLAEKLEALGIKVKTEEDARKKLLAILAKEGIEGMESEDTDILIEMAESFIDTKDASDDEVEEEEEEDDTDGDEEDSDDEEEELDELAKQVEEEDASDDEEEEEEEEEEPAVEQPKKPAKKEAKKPAKKAEEKKEAKPSKRGTKLNPRDVEDDRKAFEVFQELFNTKEYSYAWISSNGVTIKYVGKNGARGVCSIENATQKPDGSITCNLYLLTMAKETDKLDELGIDYDICWSKAPFMKGIKLEEAVDILTKVYDTITGFANKVDKRLGENRKKMEEALKKEDKKASKKEAKEPAKTEEKATKKAKKASK